MNTSKEIQATVQVGKLGLTERVLQEIDKQLRKRKIVKIKLLTSAVKQMPKALMIEKIVSLTGANLVSKTGNVIVVKK
jgi:RNA-binding protein